MRDIATATLSGNLTRDVELRSLPSGTDVARLRVATTTAGAAARSGSTRPTTSPSRCTAPRRAACAAVPAQGLARRASTPSSTGASGPTRTTTSARRSRSGPARCCSRAALNASRNRRTAATSRTVRRLGGGGGPPTASRWASRRRAEPDPRAPTTCRSDPPAKAELPRRQGSRGSARSGGRHRGWPTRHQAGGVTGGGAPRGVLRPRRPANLARQGRRASSARTTDGPKPTALVGPKPTALVRHERSWQYAPDGRVANALRTRQQM